MPNIQTEIKNLANSLNELQNKIPKQELINFIISKSSIGWHIEHTLLTNNLIIDELKKSDPNKYKWKFNFTRILVFTINRIPRGRAQSPASVLPKNIFTTESMQKNFDISKAKLNELQSLPTNSYFQHPFFGKLNLKSTLKFLGIHTKHHIQIIKDIICESGSSVKHKRPTKHFRI